MFSIKQVQSLIPVHQSQKSGKQKYLGHKKNSFPHWRLTL
jgi:hypothetical protein